MERKVVLAIVLCLAAALTIGAAPALAASGCTCHTTDPPTATAAHAPLVAAVSDCTVCHAGMTVPHPSLVEPKLVFGAEAYIADSGQEEMYLSGRLRAAGKGVNGVVVYLQQRASGASEFSDVGQVTTHRILMIGDGFFSSDGDSLTAAMAEGTSYRAVSQGQSGATVLTPRMSTVTLTPTLTLWKLSGLRNGNLRLGRSAVAIWRAAPSWLAGEKVRLILEKLRGTRFVRVRMVERILRDDGLSCRCRWEVTPRTRGVYQMTAAWPATAKHPRITAGDWAFEVK